VKFQGLCEGRGYPVLRIGVTDAQAPGLELQGLFTLSVDELRGIHRATLPARFGTAVEA
jgi:hypothetical protein